MLQTKSFFDKMKYKTMINEHRAGANLLKYIEDHRKFKCIKCGRVFDHPGKCARCDCKG